MARDRCNRHPLHNAGCSVHQAWALGMRCNVIGPAGGGRLVRFRCSWVSCELKLCACLIVNCAALVTQSHPVAQRSGRLFDTLLPETTTAGRTPTLPARTHTRSYSQALTPARRERGASNPGLMEYPAAAAPHGADSRRVHTRGALAAIVARRLSSRARHNAAVSATRRVVRGGVARGAWCVVRF